MKWTKHTCFFLSFFLLFSTSGIAFNIRYCGTEITAITIKASVQGQNLEDDCCSVVEKKAHCCKDTEIKFQKKTDDLIQKNVAFLADVNCQIIKWNLQILFLSSNFYSKQDSSYCCNANGLSFFKLYQQYIFYA